MPVVAILTLLPFVFVNIFRRRNQDCILTESKSTLNWPHLSLQICARKIPRNIMKMKILSFLCWTHQNCFQSSRNRNFIFRNNRVQSASSLFPCFTGSRNYWMQISSHILPWPVDAHKTAEIVKCRREGRENWKHNSQEGTIKMQISTRKKSISEWDFRKSTNFRSCAGHFLRQKVSIVN